MGATTSGERRATNVSPRGRWVAPALLVLASYAFRLPPLLNARSTNSDAAVVGLQAMHMLRGELAALLWGSGYQTAADSAVAAAFFAALGPTPLALMLSSLTLHVAATALVYATLRRRFSPWAAFVVTLPLVLSPSSVHSYALYPPRQLSLTLALAAFWAIDAAAFARDERRLRAWLALGGLLVTLAISADPYPLVVAPVAVLFAVLTAWPSPDDDARFRLGCARLAWFAGLAAVGLAPFTLLHRLPGAHAGTLGLTASMLGHNFDLLVQDCLPWALSYKVYYAHHVMDYAPWDAPRAVRVVQIAGALALFAAVVFALVAATMRSVPGSVRRLGFAGAVAFPVAIGGFLASVMVMDHFSMRYLAVLTLMTPFAVAPAAQALGPRRFAFVFAPHLVASAIGGWVGYGPFVRGPLPVRETPELADDYAVFHLLRARGVTYAEADYWASYRLTFLFREQIVVVPTNANEDRYAPYRRAFEGAPVFAYVFDPGRSREDLAKAERELVATNARVETLTAGHDTVLVVTRRADARAAR